MHKKILTNNNNLRKLILKSLTKMFAPEKTMTNSNFNMQLVVLIKSFKSIKYSSIQNVIKNTNIALKGSPYNLKSFLMLIKISKKRKIILRLRKFLDQEKMLLDYINSK